MEEMREFEVNKALLGSKYTTCQVCFKKFKLKEKIILQPIQKPRKGWADVISIPIHTKCFWLEKEK